MAIGEALLPEKGSPCVLEPPRLSAAGPLLWRRAPSARTGVCHPPVCPSIEAWAMASGLHPCIRLALLGLVLRPLPCPKAGCGRKASSRVAAVSVSLSLLGHCHPHSFLPRGVPPAHTPRSIQGGGPSPASSRERRCPTQATLPGGTRSRPRARPSPPASSTSQQ